MACGFDSRNQNAKARIAAVGGTTIPSMTATESTRMVRSAAAIGPCGSRIFIGAPRNFETPPNGRRARRFQNDDAAYLVARIVESRGPAFVFRWQPHRDRIKQAPTCASSFRSAVEAAR